jgi:BlaI family transcriptional regulator, penicillinase repressor
LTFAVLPRQNQASNFLEDVLPRSQSATLTEAELRIMQVLWEKGSATVQQVLEALPREKPLAYNSVLTIIRILERKGCVRHVKDGRAHIYRAVLNQDEAKRTEIQHLLGRFFQNSRELLVLNILEEEGIDDQELKRLRQLLDENR